MKIITIEQVGNGGRTKVEEEKIMVEEINEIYNSEYTNALTILGDLRKYAFPNGDIISKQTRNNKTVLKCDNGDVINLIDFNHPILDEEINGKIYKSFKNFLLNMEEVNYNTVYLTAQQNRMTFDFIESSPHFKKDLTAFVELELDENNELTLVSKLMLNEILKKELRNWIKVFIPSYDSNVLKVCYDDKKLLVNSNIIKYVKPEVEKMEEIYLQSIEETNKERGI